MTPDRTRLLPQIVAALAIVSMLLPQAVAYAAIAGMPAVHAVIAALVGLSAYAVLGSSRYAVCLSLRHRQPFLPRWWRLMVQPEAIRW